jgi:hypothetical protein
MKKVSPVLKTVRFYKQVQLTYTWTAKDFFSYRNGAVQRQVHVCKLIHAMQ